MFSSILAELVIGLHYFCLIFLCHELHSNKMKAPNGSRYRRLGEKGLETGNRQSSEKAKKTRRVPAVPCIIPVQFRDALLGGSYSRRPPTLNQSVIYSMILGLTSGL